MYNNDKLEDPELFVKMVNAKQKMNQDKYYAALKRSTNAPVIPFKPQKKEKPLNYKAILCSAALLLSIGFGAKFIGERLDTQEAYQQSNAVLAQIVSNNTYYGDYQSGSERYWWYDTEKMADDVLESADYDIDTRIYGCYKNMNTYKKNEHMNNLFWEMQNKTTEHPELYSEDIIKACQYQTFQEYLEAKNLTTEEYQKLMDQVLIAYSNEDKNYEEIASLLNELNGARDGGTR